MKKLAVYVGRFQPFHNGNDAIVKHIVNSYDSALFLVGSHNLARSVKNPFGFNTISNWIEEAVYRHMPIGSKFKSYLFPIDDYLYDESKLEAVTQTVAIRISSTLDENREIYLVGSKEDDSTYLHRLKNNSCLYAGIDLIDVSEHKSYTFVLETVLQNRTIAPFVPEYVAADIQLWRNVTIPDCLPYKDFVEEAQYYLTEKHKYKDYPYPNTLRLYTADALVLVKGKNSYVTHVLLIKRKNHPGKGLWAMPGGFVEQNENAFEAACRELMEETSLSFGGTRLSNKSLWLRTDSVTPQLYDHPLRSIGIPRVTAVSTFMFTLDELDRLNVCASDDAQEASFIPVEMLSDLPMFLDHKEIVMRNVQTLNV